MNINTEEQIILAILKRQPQSKAEFDAARTKICAEMKIVQPANRSLYATYKEMVKNKQISDNKMFQGFLKKANVRSLSGIAIITSLTKPFPCPGKCIYCPNEVRMPKSYISSEPAAARALRLEFSPYEQMKQRILMLEGNGHPTDKIEYIIKGGTWNSYPLTYQYWFVLESFRAANETSLKPKNPKALKRLSEKSSLLDLQKALEIEQRKNEKSKHRIIGLTLETRPDFVRPQTILHMRKLGCTRIELGLQAPDDKILSLIKRGHTTQQFRDAMLLLRIAGFKVDLHFMPDLPGSSAEHDVEMYKTLFSDAGLQPDMVKIYPNTVIKDTELHDWFTAGKFKPYGEENLFNALLQMKLATPRYCRISRLIRDIPANEITAGNTITNLRENLQKELERRGQRCVCLHCREISRQVKINGQKYLQNAQPQLFVDEYETTGGKEYFLSFEDKKRIAVFGFIRLRLPNKNEPKSQEIFSLLPEINGVAFIRELHVYGQLVEIGQSDENAAQHKGLGKKLVLAAEEIARKNDFQKVAVISGVGVRGYYRKLGYRKAGTYMIKSLKK